VTANHQHNNTGSMSRQSVSAISTGLLVAIDSLQARVKARDLTASA
jgi:hypothetical protein